MILLLVLFSLAGSQARPQDVEIVTLQDETITENPIVDMELGDTEERAEVQRRLGEEWRRHGDILQERFPDTYTNLTVKSLMMLKWHQTSCQGARYLLKADDDM